MAETHVRLLSCKTCGTAPELLPDFVGPAEYDDTLNYLVSKHRFPNGDPHIAHGLLRVERSAWDNPATQKEILRQIATSSGHTGLDVAFYAAKDTFLEDAMTCWKQHNRNVFCPDYMSEGKRLVPDTTAERKEAGLGKAKSTTSLCQFCPVHSMVMQAKRKKAGMYK